jgi:hypothetical protein
MHIKLTRRATADHVFCVRATTCVSVSPARRICGKATEPVRYADRRLKIYFTYSSEVLGSQHASLPIIFHPGISLILLMNLILLLQSDRGP